MAEPHENTDDTLATIEDLIESQNRSGIDTVVDALPPIETARTFGRLGRRDRARFLELLRPERLADVVSKIFELGDISIIERFSPSKRASILRRMRSDEQVMMLRELKDEDVDAILKEIKPRHAKELRDSMGYAEDTAGGLMITEYLSFTSRQSVNEVLEDLQKNSDRYSDYDIQYAYVVSEAGELVGVLPLRDILFSPKNRLIEDLMVKDPLSVDVGASLRDLGGFFSRHPWIGAPVTEADGRLIGVVRSVSVREASSRQSNKMFLKFAGIVGGEEFRTLPLFKRSSRRLSWLSINIVLNIIAASVIAAYQDTLEKAVVLAVFLPIISDMSGCSGNQAVAVSIRELTMGLIRPRELLYVLRKETSIGAINGLLLGCLLGGAALLWQGNPYLGLVVGVALAANTFVAVSIGGLVPLFLRGIRTDPALASGPFLTTITDMCGFFFVLSFASFMLPRLAG